MERMLSTTSDIGRQRRIVTETSKIDDVFLVSIQITTVPSKYRPASAEIVKETIEMITKRAANSGMVPAKIGKIMVQGSRGSTYLPKI
jgi:hypothetical protein